MDVGPLIKQARWERERSSLNRIGDLKTVEVGLPGAAALGRARSATGRSSRWITGATNTRPSGAKRTAVGLLSPVKTTVSWKFGGTALALVMAGAPMLLSPSRAVAQDAPAATPAAAANGVH